MVKENSKWPLCGHPEEILIWDPSEKNFLLKCYEKKNKCVCVYYINYKNGKNSIH